MLLFYGGLCVNFDIIGEISHGSNRTCTTHPLSCICAHNATRFLFTRFDSHMALMAQSLSRGVSETIKLYIYHTITRISSSTNFLQINLSIFTNNELLLDTIHLITTMLLCLNYNTRMHLESNHVSIKLD